MATPNEKWQKNYTSFLVAFSTWPSVIYLLVLGGCLTFSHYSDAIGLPCHFHSHSKVGYMSGGW